MSSDKGFTLIELLVSVAILGLLGAISVMNYEEMKDHAYRARAQVEIMQIATAVLDYIANDSGNELFHDCETQGNLNIGGYRVTWESCGYNWHSPYDPWGNAYALDGNGRGWETAPYQAQVCSGGPDGTITSWNIPVISDDICYSFNNDVKSWVN